MEEVLDDTDHHPTPPPLDTLPKDVAHLVANISRAHRVPEALGTICVLGVLSAAIGRGLEVESQKGRRTRANLFLLGIAESGSGKSETFRRIAKPLLDHQEHLVKEWTDKVNPKVRAETMVLDREIGALEKRSAKTISPTERERLVGELQFKVAQRDALVRTNCMPCIIAQDVTVEKLASLLRDNNEVMFSASADARKPIDNIFGRYSGTNSTDESLYLCAYSGDYVRVDRQSRDPVLLNSPCLAVCWLVQPDMMAAMMEKSSLSSGGFLPRFMMANTHAKPRKLEAEDVSVPVESLEWWNNLIIGLFNAFHVRPSPLVIAPSPEAKRLLDAFFNSTVDRRETDLSDVTEFASRHGENAWRTALVLHAATHGVEAGNFPLAEETAANAVRLVEWFVGCQLGLLARTRRQAHETLAAEVMDFLQRRSERTGKAWITARDLHNAHVAATACAARNLLAQMEADGLLLSEERRSDRGGRPTTIYRAANNTNPVPG